MRIKLLVIAFAAGQLFMPHSLPVSIHTGMRLSEQYSCMWSQVDLERRTIELTKTKNGSARTVHLNADALKTIESLKRSLQKASDPVFPREGS
jgi:integrase